MAVIVPYVRKSIPYVRQTVLRPRLNQIRKLFYECYCTTCTIQPSATSLCCTSTKNVRAPQFSSTCNTILSPLWRISGNASCILSSRFVEKVTTHLLCPIYTRAFLALVLVLVLVDIFVLSYRSPIFRVKCPSIVKQKNHNPISDVMRKSSACRVRVECARV